MYRIPIATLALSCVPFLAGPSGPARAQGKPDQPPSAQSPDKRHAAFAEDRTIKIIDGRTQRVIRSMAGHTARVTALAFSPDGKLLASGGADRSIGVWDVRTGRMLLRLKVASAVTGVSFSPDGRTLTAREGEQTVRRWDVATGRPLKQDTEKQAADKGKSTR